ncbi:hypothetical protein D210916BOD24_27870 [Alteromonas sp. D210916BOD_24]|uniref:substrate-binding periplasmic protein n=1 Tax=Alteromonas sp. D210916BOD_24 TaxID=3157618 RepID=UPI00399CA6F5
MPTQPACLTQIQPSNFVFLISLIAGFVTFSSQATTTLAASPFETYVSDDGEPARLNKIVTAAFNRANIDIELKVMRDAFLGSSVLTGKVDGEFAHVDLGENKSDFLLSDVYLPIYLYAVSKRYDVENIKLFPHLNNNRVAIENRFANTPTFRLLKEIKWSRNPSTFDAFRQLADDRAPYLITTQLLANEFNTLLAYDDEELLHFSAKPLVHSGFQLAIRNTVTNAAKTIHAFNSAVADMQHEGEFNVLLGIAWLTKDIDGDGIADFIGHSSITRPYHRHDLAYSLDGMATSEKSRFFIDGQAYASRQQSDSALPQLAEEHTTPSLLDATIYRQLIRKW